MQAMAASLAAVTATSTAAGVGMNMIQPEAVGQQGNLGEKFFIFFRIFFQFLE